MDEDKYTHMLIALRCALNIWNLDNPVEKYHSVCDASLSTLRVEFGKSNILP